MSGHPLDGATLLDALHRRRSRRFVAGATMPAGGPLAYRSALPPRPLSEDEEALLVFAACGLTGPALADLSLGPGEGGNILAGLAGRTAASGDAIASVALVVINDEASYYVRRPQDLGPGEVDRIVRLTRERRYTDAYRALRVRIGSGRAEVSREPLVNIEVNRWIAGAPGTTTFLPIDDLTHVYVNGMLELFNRFTAAWVVDDRAAFRPAGIGRFARRRGGHLDDDPARGRVATVQRVELIVTEVVVVEQGMMLQNLALMAEAMGLAGFPSFAEHEFAWFDALGFRTAEMPASRYLGGPRWLTWLLGLARRDAAVAYPVGLERDGDVLMRAFTPPYFPSMTDAVRAVANAKTGRGGVFRDARFGSAWRRPDRVRDGVPAVDEEAVEAASAYFEYLWARYGRVPVTMAPFRTALRFQAGHVDPAFYERYYEPGVLGPAFAEHDARWHSPR